MTANLALNHRDPDLTAGDLRYLVRQLDARDVPDHTPVRVRRLPIGERLVVELRQITRTVARKQVAPPQKRAAKTPRVKATPSA